MTQSQLIAQMLKEKNPNNIDIWECIYASSSFNTMVQKAFKLVKLSAGQWSFKKVIEFAEKQEFKDCRSLADTGELLLTWLGHHNIMYYMWRDAVINVLTKAKNKINTLCLEGVSNAGKSFWTRPLKRIFRFYGEMDTQAGYRFIYQDCVNKPIIFFEEPNLIPEAAQKFKLIAEGKNTYVSIKNKEDELLKRTPVILTTNNPLWKWCNAEEHAFKNRMYYFIFNRACPALMDFGEPHPLIYKLLLDNKNLQEFVAAISQLNWAETVKLNNLPNNTETVSSEPSAKKLRVGCKHCGESDWEYQCDAQPDWSDDEISDNEINI